MEKTDQAVVAPKWKKLFWPVLGVILVLGLAVVFIMYIKRPKLPPGISKKASFVVTYPSTKWKVDYESLKFQEDSKVITYNASLGDVTVTVSEQPTPDPFKDIPDYMKKVTGKMGEITSFDSAAGEVHLTRPTATGGNEVAVADSQGTLVFVRASKDLSTDDWRRYFNSLQVVK